MEPIPPAKERWYHSVWFVLLMLFVVLGPLGLPLLWKSPRFPRWSQWLLTALVGLYTVALIHGCIEAVRHAADYYHQLELTL